MLTTIKSKKGFLKFILVVFIVVGLFMIFYKGLTVYKNSQKREREMQSLLLQQEKDLSDTKQEIINIQNKAESNTKVLQDKIANIKPSTVNTIVQTGNTSDYSSIVAEWQNKVAEIECHWDANTKLGLKAEADEASGLLINYNGGTTLVTNKHVIYDKGNFTADWCGVGIYGKGSRVIEYNENSNPFNILVDKRDGAYIFLTDKYEDPKYPFSDKGFFDQVSSKHLSFCNKQVNIGDKLLILGYPGIGTQGGITVTEGIVSGIEDDYYVTSAKIDHGNSGGAAILVKDDCYLGIPTWVANNGGFESLGRILKSSFLGGTPAFSNYIK